MRHSLIDCLYFIKVTQNLKKLYEILVSNLIALHLLCVFMNNTRLLFDRRNLNKQIVT